MPAYLYEEDSGAEQEFTAATPETARTRATELLTKSIDDQLRIIDAKGRTVEFPVTVTAQVGPLTGNVPADWDSPDSQQVTVTRHGWPAK